MSNLEITQGDSYACIVNVQDSEGQPFDLTGYEVLAQIRQSTADSSDVAATFTVTPDPDLTDQVVLTLLPDETRPLVKSSYRWDLELTAPDLRVQTITRGYVKVIPEVSRRA